jgi:hypothetical protein
MEARQISRSGVVDGLGDEASKLANNWVVGTVSSSQTSKTTALLNLAHNEVEMFFPRRLLLPASYTGKGRISLKMGEIEGRTSENR